MERDPGGDTQPGADTPIAAYYSLGWESWLPLIRLAVQRWYRVEVLDPLTYLVTPMATSIDLA